MHDHRIPGLKPVFSVLVASSTRSKGNDASGEAIITILESEGYSVSGYEVVTDEVEAIKKKAEELLSSSDALVISGGTGISDRDVTIPSIREMSSKEISGFAHIFSMMSFQEIGTSAIMSSSSAFVVGKKPVFCLPGSPDGARLGVEKVILPEIDHVVHELNK